MGGSNEIPAKDNFSSHNESILSEKNEK